MKGELRFAMRTTGEPSVTTDGKTTMAVSCVDSWDSTLMVKKPTSFTHFQKKICCLLKYLVIVFCAGAIARGGGYFGKGRGTIHLDYLNCTGSELKLKDCGHSGFGNTNCYSFEEDAGVICPGIYHCLFLVRTSFFLVLFLCFSLSLHIQYLYLSLSAYSPSTVLFLSFPLPHSQPS